MDIARFAPTLGVIKPEHSPFYLLGKIFFRHQAPWQQRRKISLMIWSITIGLLIGGICAAAFIFQNNRH